MEMDNSINIDTPKVAETNGVSSSQSLRQPDKISESRELTEEPSRNASEQQEEGRRQTEEAVSRINEFVQNQQRTIRFSIDEESGRDVIRVLDKQTEELIRQIPRDEILVIARRLEELQEEGLRLFDSMA